MRPQPRLLLGVAAVIVALAGALVGWLVAVSRQATPSDAIVSAILTGAFTLLGAGIGMVVPLLQDWERNRPNLKLQLSYRCLHASPTGLRMASELFPSTITAATGPPLMYTWKRCKPEEPTASLVLFLDLPVQHPGYLDEASTD